MHRTRTLVVASALVLWAGTAAAQYQNQQQIRTIGPRGGPISNTETNLPPALDAPEPAAHDGPIVQLALLLDTSNSMDGLIDQARAELWTVVNRLQGLRHEAGGVQFRVALYQYGNDSLESSDGFVQLRAPFTTDLDIISEQLFALTTNGGSEYCGWVIGDAMEELDWIAPTNADDAAPVLRMIVIAGNEPFSQGSVAYSETIAQAVNAGVRVHSVFCGDEDNGRSTYWAEGASLGEGFYFAIDQGQRVRFATPFDDELLRYNRLLNSTYYTFDGAGRASLLRQGQMDVANEAASTEQMVQRAATKATANYDNRTWDITDAWLAGELDEDDIEPEALPEDWRGLTFEELLVKVEENAQERERINERIRALFEQREAEVAKQREALGILTLGMALSTAIIDQARELGFTHVDDAPEPEPETEPAPDHEAPLDEASSEPN